MGDRIAPRRLAAWILLTGLVGPLLLACSTQQRLMVSTSPEGADVTLQLIYERETHTRVIVAGTRTFDPPEITEPIPLGPSPAAYAFPPVETERSVNVLGLGGQDVRLHYREGVVRVTMPGYLPAEYRFPVSRGLLNLHFDLEPVSGEPGQ